MNAKLVRARRAPLAPGDGPLLVMLHGLGSNEQDLMFLAPQLPPHFEIVSFRAPVPYGPGYSWFPIDWNDQGIVVDQDQALASRDRLVSELEALLAETGRRQLVIGGFSQGAIMSLGVLLSRPDLVQSAALLSGRPLPRFVESAVQLPGTPVLVQHGQYDPVLPPSGSTEVADRLRSLGADVVHREYPMGHEVSLESLMDLRDWLSRFVPSA